MVHSAGFVANMIMLALDSCDRSFRSIPFYGKLLILNENTRKISNLIFRLVANRERHNKVLVTISLPEVLLY